MEQSTGFDVFFTLLLFLIIFSPFVFSRRQKEQTEWTGWRTIVKSRWFGIPLIFLLLFSYFGFLNIALTVTFSVLIAFCISLAANTLTHILNRRLRE
ncbi:hypothetical protein [Salisediminibacterium beveridgei]|uniref:Uncharacterized protein n=1 Tax=Salisediminibacterium beveridgei TaxID=632773 RepID=A0A1D7QZB7_9BACI|nr:hypothetical protein [Salisediminibacterium beveridgei]AOM84353.1 hypothetical protein BBEV_3035 [Salisediminibacterium beveridgei]